MPLVTPTPISPQPAAPLPTDDRVSFAGKAFSWVGSMEPTRVAFNLIATQTNTNAAYAHERADAANDSAILAGQRADVATDAVIAVNQTVADILAAKNAIQAGPVASVMGRTGVVTGLVEVNGPQFQAPALIADAPFGWSQFRAWGVEPGSDWPTAATTAWWNVLTIGATGHKTQRASQVYPGAQQGWVFERQMYETVWSAWKRVLNDGSIIERWAMATINSGTCTVDPSVATVWWIEPSANVAITVAAPRATGDQIVLRLVQRGSFGFSFVSNVKFPKGVAGLSIANGECLTVTLIPEFGGGLMWNAFIGAKHSV